MNILIIGGTRFQGRHLVQNLLTAGHFVTVFHKGSHSIDPHGALVNIIGNRNNPEDLGQLAGHAFDACIDTCAYFPAQISLAADTLKIQHYCLISSVYVYKDEGTLLREDSQLLRMHGVCTDNLTPHNYGALKALCEEETLRRFGNTSLIIRPSIIIGAGDHTERLLFWLRLASRHGKRLDILPPSLVIQLVDVRDLASFTVKCIEEKRHGPVNVCGKPVSLSSVLDMVESITGRQLVGMTVRAENLPRLGIERLPYCEGGHHASYDTVRSHTWGFVDRNLRDSLADIHADCQLRGFSMQNFQAEEVAVLRLFS